MTEDGHNSGKWRDPDFLKDGWYCAGMYDLGADSRVCEMCEKAWIRYVHIMRHPEIFETLRTGCVCAGNLSGDIEGAIARDTKFKSGIRNLSARRRNFPYLKSWKLTPKGNERIEFFDRAFVVGKDHYGPGYWTGFYGPGGVFKRAPRTFDSTTDAKLYIFDRVAEARDRWKRKWGGGE